MRSSSIALIVGVAVLVLLPAASHALDGYSSQDKKTFMDWCTLEESNTESICSCTLKSVAATVPASALTSYVSSKTTGQSMSLSSLATSAGTSTAIAVTQALTTCGN